MNEPNVHTPENCLVERAAAGDRDARHELFERYREIAYRVAFRVTGRHEDALDVVQDAFIKAFDRLGGFQAEASFKTWLLRIVTNRGLDLLRSRKVRLAVSLERDEESEGPGAIVPGNEAPPSAGLEQSELSQRMEHAIDDLPAEQRAVFALHAGGEMTYGQIAEAVGIPIGTVMSRLYHARRRLQEALKDLAPRDVRQVQP